MFLKNVVEKLHIKALNYKLLIYAFLIIIGVFGVMKARGANVNPKDTSRTYALRIETGSQSELGYVGTFVVVYKDKKGDKRRAYINPADGDLVRSMKAAQAGGMSETIKARIKNYQDVFGYNFEWLKEIDPNNNIISENTYQLHPITTPLKSNSIDTYFFKTDYEVDEILSIGVMAGDSKTVTKTWRCYGMSLYQVDKIQGIIPYGYMSNTFELGFTGTCVASMRYQNSSSYKGIAAEFQLIGKDIKYVQMNQETAIGPFTTAQLVKRNDPYTNADFDNDEYTIKMDIADVYMAGFEQYIAKNKKSAKLSTLKPAELLVYNISYLTESGALRSVNIPVVTASLSYAIETGAITGDTELADILAQGNSIAFTAHLPEFSSILSTTLYYISGEGEAAAGLPNTLEGLTQIKSVFNDSETHASYYNAMKNDWVSFTGIQMYKGASAVEVSLNDTAALKVNVTAGAQMLYKASAPTSNGISLNSGANKIIDLEPAAGSTVSTIDDRNLFIFEAKTSYIENAGTVSDISAVIKYIDNEDNEKQFEFRFKDGAKDFFGYWPDEKGNDTGYELCVQNGAKYYALLDIESVKQFVGITFSNKDADDWMAENVTIYHVEDNDSLGGITYRWNGDDKAIKVIHGREYNGHVLDYQTDLNDIYLLEGGKGLDILVSFGGSTDSESGESSGIYIGGNRDRNISFVSAEVGQQSDNRTNIFEYMDNMSYEIANTDFGFGARRIEYTVDVHVASDPYGSIQNGNRYDDCGSTNYFYFQLVFEKGNSAYVQANQQMNGDSFRSGVVESFNIYLNQDYGALQAINIIPEVDESSGKPYDKLNIEKIVVNRDTPNGLAQTFETNAIGWVGIDYSDNGGKEKYHKEAQLAKTYTFARECSTAHLLFQIGYDSIPSDFQQFQGTATALVRYKKTDGSIEVKEFDIVRAMHKFNGTLGIATEADITSKDGKSKLLNSDPNLMFRPNHTDRFIWDAEDIKYVESIEIEAKNKSGKNAYINISNICITVIKSADIDSNRSLNRSGEYIIENAGYGESNVITSVEGKYEMKLSSEATGRVTVKFDIDEGTCISSEDKAKFPYIVTRQPVSEKDTVNIYAYISDTNEDVSKFEVHGAIDYDDKLGGSKQVPDVFHYTTIIDENGNVRQAYVCEGLLVKNFKTFKDVGLVAYGTGPDIAIDYIVVQHVRNNVVLKSYRADYPTPGTGIKGFMVYTTSSSDFNDVPGYQEITLQFGDKMDKTTIIKEQRDVAISLDYVFGNTNKEYKSENIFISDGNIRSIAPGDIVKLRVHNSNVGRIDGISVAATEYLKIDVKAITVGVYSSPGEGNQKNGSYECKEWYSFDCNTIIENETKHFNVTSNEIGGAETWSPVTVKIKTLARLVSENGSFGSDLGLAKDQSLMMVVTYEEDGKLKEYMFKNIVDNVISGDFSAGKTAEFVFLAKNLTPDMIRKVSFRPYDDTDDNVIWGIDTLSISFGDGTPSDTVITAEPRRAIYEEDGLNDVSFVKVVLSADVRKVDASVSTNNDQVITGSTVVKELGSVKQSSDNLIKLDNLSTKDVFKIDVNVQNSDQKFTVKDGPGINVYRSSDDSVYLSVNGNVGDIRTVKIISDENIDSFLEIKFEIGSKEAAPSVEEEAPSNEEEKAENANP